MSTSSVTPPEGLPRAYDTLGPYRLAGTLGEGGMGVVYLGLDRSGRAVAIKALRPHIAADAEARARLAREVATLERVRHRRVAAVLDADPAAERPYVVTRYVPGPPLDEHVRTHGPFRGDALVRLARGLHEALGAIHAAGVVHRDLKPGNVLVVDGDPVVIDFGISHVADDVRLTSTGLVMGTPGYLAPEVLGGGQVTESTDWWGWAATLAYAATGVPPFGLGRVDVVLDRVRRGEHDLTGVDPRLRPLLAAALDPDPTRRPAARTVLDALEQVARGGTPTLGPGASGRTELLPTSRWPQGTPVAGRAAQARVDARGRPGAEAATGPGARPARTAELTGLCALVVALAATVPVVALLVAVAWSVLARTVDRSLRATALRRMEAGGRRGSDLVVAVVRSPFQAVAAALTALVDGVLGILVALLVAHLVSLVAHLAGGLDMLPGGALPLSAGALVGCWSCWWGAGGRSLRRGSRAVARALTPTPRVREVAAVGALVVVAALAGWAVLRAGAPVWSPLTQDPLAGETLPWR